MLKHRYFKKHRPSCVTALSIVVVCLLSCIATNANPAGIDQVKRTDIVAGPREKTLPDRYSIKIELPMAEVTFLSLLSQMHLDYAVCGKHGIGTGIPAQRHKSTVDFSRAATCYHIAGGNNLKLHAREAWRAYADENHEIFYIESAYGYTGT